MANELSELDLEHKNDQGRAVHVIDKKLAVEVGRGSLVFEIILWSLFIIPGLVFLFMKINAKKELDQVQQKIQHHASQIDNYQEQRFHILENAARIVEKSINLDKEVMEKVSLYRSGANKAIVSNNFSTDELQSNLNNFGRQINLAFEAYPELKAQNTLRDAMQQNSYLQKEVTAARELYNDVVFRWNAMIFEWPTKKIVAAKYGYTTRIPFMASKEVKEKLHFF
ncbi:conserved hypothetical protein [Mycoplasmopsis pulmonis]|uniref:LemA family protein n=1 Tax=Mycoplasmopsis pulmonis (strain UAB CTIP) TaxID=272635 RepID=Q98PG5_MYCPU|nr:LemA family protein [Mycoplasmopsis pulmonis]MDZ7293397.1 LemA family protein [Mycoplasmopsis pulmonis]CAC13931.1 conserved hypothetical protein [Mycoplasmopsis pulmonis]VEU68522.1 LemA family [Mycoplasmopsis pulmonis]